MPNKPVIILQELLAAEGGLVSGGHLAEVLGISRVSVWSHLDRLRAQGFEFEAARSKGYRLTRLPESLNATLVQALLTKPAAGLRVIAVDEIDSTNSEAERRLANGEETPFLVIARRQSQGRGRLGRVWHSPDLGNLYATFAFRPQISPSFMALFTLWMGVNLCECINAFCSVQSGVKWPNDLHISGKKVAGILTEARMEADLVRDVILGVGLNVNAEESDWPEELRQIATSLRQFTGQAYDLNRLAAALAGRVMMAYQQFKDGAHRAGLKEKWPSYDTLRGKRVSLSQGDNRISGIASGIDSAGALVIERPDGTRFQARAGEVTLDKNPK